MDTGTAPHPDFCLMCAAEKDKTADTIEPKKLIEGAIKGMLSTLDPHTVYLSPESFKEMQVDTSGKFGGLGIEISACQFMP